MPPWPAVAVSGGGRDKGRRGIAVMINPYLAFATDIDVIERTLAGNSWNRGDKMGGGRSLRSTLAARGTIHCVGESANAPLALKISSASSSAYVRGGSKLPVNDGVGYVRSRGRSGLDPAKGRRTRVGLDGIPIQDTANPSPANPRPAGPRPALTASRDNDITKRSFV